MKETESTLIIKDSFIQWVSITKSVHNTVKHSGATRMNWVSALMQLSQEMTFLKGYLYQRNAHTLAYVLIVLSIPESN